MIDINVAEDIIRKTNAIRTKGEIIVGTGQSAQIYRDSKIETELLRASQIFVVIVLVEQTHHVSDRCMSNGNSSCTVDDGKWALADLPIKLKLAKIQRNHLPLSFRQGLPTLMESENFEHQHRFLNYHL